MEIRTVCLFSAKVRAACQEGDAILSMHAFASMLTSCVVLGGRRRWSLVVGAPVEGLCWVLVVAVLSSLLECTGEAVPD
jgi:hypothetical protein